jgi:hypothetical protein
MICTEGCYMVANEPSGQSSLGRPQSIHAACVDCVEFDCM